MRIPFDAIAQLTNLKALVLNKVWSDVTEIPESICNLRQMIYFEISNKIDLKQIPIKCISTHWNNLMYFDFVSFWDVKHDFDPSFWQLPKLETAYFDQSYFGSGGFEFDTFGGFSDSLKHVSFSKSPFICAGSIIINNVEYEGFGYLSNHTNDPFTATNVENDQSRLLEFIQKFDPCTNHCQNQFQLNWNSQILTCSNLQWADGYCDENCNDYDCQYDGGDWYV